jgi:hypothetical protein
MVKLPMSLAAAVLIIVLVFSGCTEQQGKNSNTNNSGTNGGITGFSVDSNGGEFTVLNDNVEVNVPSGAVSEQVNITVASIANPVPDSSLTMLSCYEFGPDGLSFSLPIDVILHYSLSDIPSGVEESSLKVYVLSGDSWEPIEGSFANQMLHYAVAKVSHFSKMACCGPAPSQDNSDDDSSSDSNDDGNSSAQYWFKADLYFYDYKTPRLVDGDDDDQYSVGVSAYWKPVSYVQYYQIKFDYRNNPPANAYAWGCDWSEQNNPECGLKSLYNKQEGYIYHIGGDPNLDGYLTLYDASEVATASYYNRENGEMEYHEYGRLRPAGSHGFGFIGVYDTVEDSEGLSDVGKQVLVGDMQTFVHDYVDGWEIWVRAVTERGD